MSWPCKLVSALQHGCVNSVSFFIGNDVARSIESVFPWRMCDISRCIGDCLAAELGMLLSGDVEYCVVLGNVCVHVCKYLCFCLSIPVWKLCIY